MQQTRKAKYSKSESLDDETREAILLLIAKVEGKIRDIHIKTQQIGDDFLADCRDRKLSPKTLEGYILHIRKLVTLSEWFPPSPKVIQQALGGLNGTHNADSHYRTWHTLGNYAKREYGIPNFMDGVNRPGIPTQIMPTITIEILKRLAVILRDAPARDRAIMALFIDTAIRSGEATSLRRDDILEDRIIVKGKTGFRAAPLSPITRDMLLALPKYKDGYVFHGIKGTRYANTPLQHTGLWKIVNKYLRAAGYEGKQASPQILRRSFGRFWFKDGGDPKSLQIIYGHTTLITTLKHYAAFQAEDVAETHHEHTPARVFEDVSSQRIKEYGLLGRR